MRPKYLVVIAVEHSACADVVSELSRLAADPQTSRSVMQRTHMDLQGTSVMSDVVKLENGWERGSKLLQWRVWPADQPSPCGSRPLLDGEGHSMTTRMKIQLLNAVSN